MYYKTNVNSHHGGSSNLATIYLTNECNLCCEYCYAIENKFEPEDTWDYEQIKKIVAHLNALGYNLSIGGGEPLLEKELLSQTIREARSKKTGVSLLTNGYLLNQETLKELAQLTLNWIQISADNTGHIQRFSDIIKEGRRLGIKIAIGTVISKSNAPFLETMIDELEKTQIYAWRILRYTPLNKKKVNNNYHTNEEWISFLLDLEKTVNHKKPSFQIRYEPSIIPYPWLQSNQQKIHLDICGGRIARRLFFFPNGEVYSCGLPNLRGIKLGNCKSDIDQLAGEIKKRRLFNNSQKMFSSLQEYCSDFCQGACIQMSGGKGCDPRCELSKELVPVCCFEKLQISSGFDNRVENIYPSSLYSLWQKS